MKFVIENISKSSGRLGQLVLKEGGKQLKTPLLLQTTKGGSIPYLSREVFDYITEDTHALQMTLSTMDHMEESLKIFNGGLSAYVGFSDFPTMLVIRDPCETIPSGYSEKDMVPMFTRRGKESLTATRYMELVEAFSPDIYQGLNDADTNLESAKKRVQKSVDRTNQFMEFCYSRHRESEKLHKSALFVPIVGGYNTFARSNSIKHAKLNAANVCSGYVFEGFHNYGLSATEVTADKVLGVIAHCQNEMDVDKPKMMPGAYTPIVALELIRLGVDIFDTSYAYCASANFKALSFHFNINVDSANRTEQKCSRPFVDITDESMKEDFTPLLSECKCLACSKHTRAYIHHLYVTKELLGPILLMIHNLHHYIEFFEVVRECISKESLTDLINLIKYQSTDKEIDYRIYKHNKEITRAGFGKGFATTK